MLNYLSITSYFCHKDSLAKLGTLENFENNDINLYEFF